MNININRGDWIVKNSNEAYENAWITVRHHDVITPGGTKGIYGEVNFKLIDGRKNSRSFQIEENITFLTLTLRNCIKMSDTSIPPVTSDTENQLPHRVNIDLLSSICQEFKPERCGKYSSEGKEAWIKIK